MPMKCFNCGKEMTQVKDSITKTFTGYNWKCKCMPKDMILTMA